MILECGNFKKIIINLHHNFKHFIYFYNIIFEKIKLKIRIYTHDFTYN